MSFSITGRWYPKLPTDGTRKRQANSKRMANTQFARKAPPGTHPPRKSGPSRDLAPEHVAGNCCWKEHALPLFGRLPARPSKNVKKSALDRLTCCSEPGKRTVGDPPHVAETNQSTDSKACNHETKNRQHSNEPTLRSRSPNPCRDERGIGEILIDRPPLPPSPVRECNTSAFPMRKNINNC